MLLCLCCLLRCQSNRGLRFDVNSIATFVDKSVQSIECSRDESEMCAQEQGETISSPNVLDTEDPEALSQ